MMAPESIANTSTRIASVAHRRVRPYPLGLLDLEGSPRHGLRMAYQLGVGGGVRLGVVVRRSRTAWR